MELGLTAYRLRDKCDPDRARIGLRVAIWHHSVVPVSSPGLDALNVGLTGLPPAGATRSIIARVA